MKKKANSKIVSLCVLLEFTHIILSGEDLRDKNFFYSIQAQHIHVYQPFVDRKLRNSKLCFDF